jgi:hypothetical protein
MNINLPINWSWDRTWCPQSCGWLDGSFNGGKSSNCCLAMWLSTGWKLRPHKRFKREFSFFQYMAPIVSHLWGNKQIYTNRICCISNYKTCLERRETKGLGPPTQQNATTQSSFPFPLPFPLLGPLAGPFPPFAPASADGGELAPPLLGAGGPLLLPPFAGPLPALGAGSGD